jgi:hypothetical protein
MADGPAPALAALARRPFQSEVLDVHITAAELNQLTHDQLLHLSVELRQRLDLLEEELKMLGRQCETVGGDLKADVHRAMVDLRHFLLFFEERVLRHRLRLRRDGKASARPDGASSATDVA